MKYKRILLKLSGESMAGKSGQGFDTAMLALYANEIKMAVEAGAQVAIVLGGGNIFRGKTTEPAATTLPFPIMAPSSTDTQSWMTQLSPTVQACTTEFAPTVT